jgi:hypothetical protein
MTRNTIKMLQTVVLIALAILVAGCNEIARQSTPVELVVTNTQTLTHIDIAPAAANCNQFISTVTVRSLLLSNPNNGNLPLNSRFTSVQLTSYRVTWQRRDGGTLIPAPFSRSTSGSLAVGETTALSNFIIFTPDMLTQAPFAALTPGGGKRDPETGRAVVTMDAILEVFGETLAGDRVSGSTRMTLDFCFSCGGCS